MKRNTLIALWIWLLSLCSFFLLAQFSWGGSTQLLHSLRSAPFLWLIGFALVTALIRRYLLARPFSLGRILLLFLLLFTLTFQSIFWPRYTQPTFLVIWPFWHLLWLIGMFLLDWTAQRLDALKQWARTRGVRLCVIILFLLGGYWLLLSSRTQESVLDWFGHSPFWVILGLPLISAYWRRHYFQKTFDYLAGLFLMFLAGGWLLFPGPHDSLRSADGIQLVVLYGVLWLHVAREALQTWLIQLWTRLGKVCSDWFKTTVAKVKQLRPTKAFTPRTPAVVGQAWGRAWSWVQAHRKSLIIGLVVVVALGTLVPLSRTLYQLFFVDVVQFSPRGEVSDRVTLRVTFSDPVQVKGEIEKLDCLTLTPALPGSYRLASDRTLVYVPSQALKPATQYRVRFKPTASILGVRKRLITSAETVFYTPAFGLQDNHVFYNVDPVTGEELEVVAELDFNYPVDPAELRQHVALKLDGQAVPWELERSLSKTRYYLKASGIKPKNEGQTATVFLSKDLKCVEGTLTLGSDRQIHLQLPTRPKLEVSEIKLWHETGATLISLLFNQPIPASEIKRCVRLEPEVAFTVETEYAYAVLRGHFKPNVDYKVKVDRGLKSRSGQALEHEREETVTITNLPPQVRFAHAGNLLSLSGPKTLEIRSVNLDEVHVRIQKVFRNNLLDFLDDPENPPRLRPIYEGDYTVEGGEINEELSQYLNLATFQQEPYKGLFKLDLSDPKTSESQASAWFLCTDLGLVAKHSGDDLLVTVLSIETLQPRPGVALELISTDNQVMDHQVTDDAGRARFTNWKNHEYKLVPDFLMAKTSDDLSFLQFSKSEMNQFQFSVGGDPQDRKNLEAFLSTERGVYRPGETVHLTAIVRNADNSLPPNVPLRLEVRDPRSGLLKQQTLRVNPNGLATLDLPISGDALTGLYEVRLFQIAKDESVGLTSFKVEEFIPDKIKVEVKAPKQALAPQQPLTFTVQARQLFGAPAAKSKVVTTVRFYSRIFSHPDYADYNFTDGSASFEDQEVELGQDTLDESGLKTYSLEIPRLTPPSALKAYLYSEVYDTGGRPVSAAGYVDIDPYPEYLGLKLEGEAPHLTKQEVRLRTVALDPQGKPQHVAKARLVVKRKAWYSIFRSNDWGRSGYQSGSYEELITDQVIDLRGKGSYAFTPAQEGEYRVLLISPSGMRTSLSVNVVGLGYDVASLESPEKLKLVLDKKAYAVGDEARVFVRAPFPGKLFLTLEREKVYETRMVEMTGRETTVSLPVSAEHLPNMYVVGLLMRKPDAALKTLPMVSFGVEPLMVKTDSKRLGMTWDLAKEVRSSQGIEVSLSVANGAENTQVVLAAVDEGILQITGFATPDPLGYFYRKRSLTTLSYTILNLLLPDVVAKKFAIGGGDSGEFTRRHLNPVQAKKKRSMALVSGILTPDENGQVRYHFDTRGFNGEVRVMALAAGRDHYGSSAKAVVVADPLVLLPNFPRFLAPQDEFQVPVEVYNKLGHDAQVTLRLSATAPIKVMERSASQTFLLRSEEQKRVVFPAEVLSNAGVAKLKVTAKTTGYEAAQEEEISVRPSTTLRSSVKQGRLDPGASVELLVPKGFIPFGQRIRFSTSGNPLFQYLGVLDALIMYPYGCAEQITSQVFPLLYYKELGFATGRFAERANAVDEYVQAGIEKLEKLQTEDGDFALWPGGSSGGRWLHLYIVHFLLEAQRHGYTVGPEVMARIKKFVLAGKTLAEEKHTPRLDQREVHEDEPQVEPYLLYLKALLNEPDRESMNYILTKALKDLSESDRAILSMTYSELGDMKTAVKVLTPDFKSRFLYREQYGSFNSSLRNTAMVLAALAQADPASPRILPLVTYLTNSLDTSGFGNTQESAWMLMALAKVYGPQNQPVRTEILMNGTPYKLLEGKDLSLMDLGLSGQKLTVKNTGSNPSYYFLLAEGTPLEKSNRSSSQGLKLTRSYSDASGRVLNLGNVAQGSLVVVSLTVSAVKEAVHNVVVVDLLPSGFEIENPRLSSRGQLGYEPGMSLSPAYEDIRDDRILLFSDAIEGSQTFSYTVRAVTPGRFILPNALAEALYDPSIKAEFSEPKALVVSDNNGQ